MPGNISKKEAAFKASLAEIPRRSMCKECAQIIGDCALQTHGLSNSTASEQAFHDASRDAMRELVARCANPSIVAAYKESGLLTYSGL